MAQFRSLVHKAFSDEHSQSVTIEHIESYVNTALSQSFTNAEIMLALDQMQDANQVMVSEGMVFLI